MARTGWKRALAAAAVAMGLSAALVAPAPAQAAGLCGSGYTLVEHINQDNDVSDVLEMYIDIYYSSSAKRNCLVVSHAGWTYGKPMYTLAVIRPTGAAWPACNSVGCDEGDDFKYFAGPVWTPAGVDMSHRCIDLDAEVGYNTHQELRGVHCG